GKVPRKSRKRNPLTVCIAAICNFKNTIFGACDRMMTSGDIEFEPDLPSSEPSPAKKMWENTNPKIYMPTTSIVVMTAGDSGLQAEIMAEVMADIDQRFKREPNKWVDVKYAVESYLNSYDKA